MEALHGNAIFDITLTYWLGLVIFALLALWVIGSGAAAIEDFGKARDKRLAVISWIFFGALIVAVLLTLKATASPPKASSPPWPVRPKTPGRRTSSSSSFTP
jgi:hypothetical protein